MDEYTAMAKLILANLDQIPKKEIMIAIAFLYFAFLGFIQAIIEVVDFFDRWIFGDIT